MKIVNLTPHAISIHDDGNNFIMTVDPSGYVLRVTTTTQLVGYLGEIPIFETVVDGGLKLQYPDGIEYPIKDVYADFPEAILYADIYIVSGMIRQYQDYYLFYQPGALLRNVNGVVIGCRGLSR